MRKEDTMARASGLAFDILVEPSNNRALQERSWLIPFS